MHLGVETPHPPHHSQPSYNGFHRFNRAPLLQKFLLTFFWVYRVRKYLHFNKSEHGVPTCTQG